MIESSSLIFPWCLLLTNICTYIYIYMYTCVRPLNMNMYKYSTYIYIYIFTTIIYTYSQHTVQHLHLLQAYKHILCVFPTCSKELWRFLEFPPSPSIIFPVALSAKKLPLWQPVFEVFLKHLFRQIDQLPEAVTAVTATRPVTYRYASDGGLWPKKHGISWQSEDW